VAKHLEGHGINAAAIHGNKSQNQREQALDAFKRGRIRVLVATDIAARGIDVDGVSHVINFELPEVPEAYVHRIGRTARAGADGRAISLCDAAERDLLRGIEKLTRQSIPSEDRRNDARIAADKIAPHPAPSRGNGNVTGRSGGRNRAPAADHHDGRPGGRNQRNGQGRSRRRRGKAGGPVTPGRGRDPSGPARDRAEAAP
jgi:ATP-dependent RNA helicase RhlE